MNADNCAEFANQIFNNSADMNGSTLVLGAIFFTFQIYGDFSGYSDIAIGTSRLFGFYLKQNFLKRGNTEKLISNHILKKEIIYLLLQIQIVLKVSTDIDNKNIKN